jgi:monoamine oxidase
VLSYCQELEVALEPYIMNTTGNLFQTKEGFKGNPIAYRRVQNDARGYIAELLAKAINQGALQDEITGEDRNRLLCLLKTFGPLNAREKAATCDQPNSCEESGTELENFKYQGSTRDGCAVDPEGRPTPNVYHNCEIPTKIPLDELLNSEFWENSFYDPVEFEWQPTLFQPVGGMDKIVEGFLRKVGHMISYNAPVTEITLTNDRVDVQYKIGARTSVKSADYCVSNIPCPILSKIDLYNFEQSMEEAIERTTFDGSCKVGWQSNTRFWESDYEIYGGISCDRRYHRADLVPVK